MAELAFASLVVAFLAVLAFHGWTERRHAADTRRLVDAIVARNAGEYAGLRALEDPPKPREPRRLDDADFQVGS